MTSPATSFLRPSTDAELPAGSFLPAVDEAIKQRCANVLGVQIEAVNMAGALARIADVLTARQKGYVCMGGVHGIMEAQRSEAVRRAFADSLMTLPDGMPMVWVGRSQGFAEMRRVTGPDLMCEIIGNKEFAGFSHFFYGGKPGIAEELAARFRLRFPWIRIAGTFTPPFCDLNHDEACEFIAKIRQTKPSIIWVGISTPRQELFMQKYLPHLNNTLMFGVGAAFDFHTGRIKDCAEWIKSAGLQWLHRLVQDPRHLLWRYMRNNPAFLWRIGLQMSGFDAPISRGQKLVQQDKRSLLCESSSEP